MATTRTPLKSIRRRARFKQAVRLNGKRTAHSIFRRLEETGLAGDVEQARDIFRGHILTIMEMDTVPDCDFTAAIVAYMEQGDSETAWMLNLRELIGEFLPAGPLSEWDREVIWSCAAQGLDRAIDEASPICF